MAAGVTHRERTARRFLGAFRLLIAALELIALIGNYQYVQGFRLFATANFFGYFTVQSAMIALVVLIFAGVLALTRDRDPAWLGTLRTMVMVYVLVSGVVFAVIVVQASTIAYRVDVPWSDTLLHFVVPGLALIAWVADSVIGVNPRVSWATSWWVLIFPSVWLVGTLWRGAEVGWYPYFFLDETQVGGYLGVALYCAIVLVIFLAITTALVALNRRLVTIAERRRSARAARADDAGERSAQLESVGA